MAITNAKAIYGLVSAGDASRTSTDGSVTIGVSQSTATLTGADIHYSFKVTSDAASDVATLTLSTGVVAQTTGTPTITDGSGVDFEGKTLTALASISGLLVSFDTVGTGTIQMAGSNPALLDYTADVAGSKSLQVVPTGKPLSGTSVAFTFSEAGQVITVNVIGKST